MAVGVAAPVPTPDGEQPRGDCPYLIPLFSTQIISFDRSSTL